VDLVGGELLEPPASGIGEEERQLVDDSSIIPSNSSQLACQPDVCQPQLWLGFTIVLGDAGWGSNRAWQRCAANYSAEDSRARRFRHHSVFVAVVTPTAVSVLATFLCIPMSAAAMLVDVLSSVVLPLIVDEALLDGYCFPFLRGWFLMHRRLPLVSGWLDVSFCGCTLTSRG